MKTLKLPIVAALALFTVACGPAGKDAETSSAKEITATKAGETFNVDSANSVVNWTGSKIAGEHNGTLAVYESHFQVVNSEIIGGEFTFDMKSLKNTDQEGEWAAKLEGHLMSEDFFHVDSFPTGKFVISTVAIAEANPEANVTVTGNLTLKDVTKSISFDALVKINNDSIKMAAPSFIIDRTEWNVKYGSSKITGIVKDKAISDDMAISFTVVAAK